MQINGPLYIMQIDGSPYLMYNPGPAINNIHDLQERYSINHGSRLINQLPIAFLISNVGPGLFISWVHASTPVTYYISNIICGSRFIGTLAILIHCSTPVTYCIPISNVGPGFYTSWVHASTLVTYCIPNIIGGSMFIH